MAHQFDESVVSAILRHMNGDHADDNLLIARAFGAPGATASVMEGLDGAGGTWAVTEGGVSRPLAVAWPGGSITERGEVRREVVALYDAACARLGLQPRPHA